MQTLNKLKGNFNSTSEEKFSFEVLMRPHISYTSLGKQYMLCMNNQYVCISIPRRSQWPGFLKVH